MDAIGLASSIGDLAGFAHGLGQASRSGRIAGNVDNAAQASRVASQLEVNPRMAHANPIGNSPVAGVIPKCFTERHDILVRLPDDPQLAETPIALLGHDEFRAEESRSAGGIWMLTGAALVAVGAKAMISTVRDRKTSRKKKRELEDLDAIFCDYERMEAAVV